MNPMGRSRRRMSLEQAQRLIERTNEVVSVFDVLTDFFGISHPSQGRSYKGYCPFGFEHPDGGSEKGFRTYPATNSSYCFFQHGSMPPVRLIQIDKGWKAVRAAYFLLDHYGLSKPQHYRKRFAALQIARETAGANLGRTSYLVEALHTGLASHEKYQDAQYTDTFSAALEEELETLDGLLADRDTATEEAVREWYAKARRRLLEVLNESPRAS